MYLAIAIFVLGLLFLGTFKGGRQVLGAVFGGIIAIIAIGWVLTEPTREANARNEQRREAVYDQVRVACGHKPGSNFDDDCFFRYYDDVRTIGTIEECGDLEKDPFDPHTYANCLITRVNRGGQGVLGPPANCDRWAFKAGRCSAKTAG
jgi:hypothetical protein